jgi:predicted glycosyltransferase
MKIWIDFDNTPHVNFLLPIIEQLKKDHEFIFTARDVFETLPYLRTKNIYPEVYGNHKGKNRVMKMYGLISRTINLLLKLPAFDVSIALGGNSTATISKLKGKKSIVFSDNDISFKTPAYKFGSYFIFPSYFNTSHLKKKYGIRDDQVFKFNGFKEDIYIANYKPDPDFLGQLPFKNFITIRPENLKASYVPHNSTTIVPQLFDEFRDKNILYLPRYQEERQYSEGYNNIFTPIKPLNGLDICHYTDAMLTGAGTFAREAALLGTPAVSFFPGKTFLTVDKIMQENGWEFKSRNPREIREFVDSALRRNDQIESSQKAFEEFMKNINTILKNISEK